MTANRPIEVWEAALGRHVVLIEARTWFEARDVARTMLGGEPEHVGQPRMYMPDWRLGLFDKSPRWYQRMPTETLAMRHRGGHARI